MKKVFKVIIVVAASILVISFLAYLVLNEKLPEGKKSIEADRLAEKMLEAIKHKNYLNTRYLEWSFMNQHHYKWDKKRQIVTIQWDKYIVDLNIQNPKESTVLLNNTAITTNSKVAIIKKAEAYFNNDSFWLIAPHKIFDTGTERSIVELEDNSKALLVHYNSGGNTPGDSYLWILDENGLPKSFKLWVSILPIGGLEATWEGWEKTENGATLSTIHKILIGSININNVKAFN